MRKPYRNRNMIKRENTFEQIFGRAERVWHEISGQMPHIDIFCFAPTGAGRDFFTMTTSGMSDHVMNVPPELPLEYPRRVELVFYCTEPRAEYAEFLRRLAHYPLDNNTWFGIGHTMETAAISLLGNQDIEALLFIPAPFMPDESLAKNLHIDNDPVSLIWVVPITKNECALISENGCCATILDLFSQLGRPYVFDSHKRQPMQD